MRALPFLMIALTPTMLPAQSGFSLPAGCDAYMTVQSRSCTVSHHFACSNDAAGLQRRVDLDQDGVTYIGAIDAETQWIESIYLNSGHSEVLEPDPIDRASFTELTEMGADTYDFVTLSDEIGPTRYAGADSLTGRTVTIDGITLEETRYSIRSLAPDGTEQWAAEGNEYISRDWRLFLSGSGTTTVGNDSFESDDSPVEFIFPGETGFLSTDPKHGCGVTMSVWTQD